MTRLRLLECREPQRYDIWFHSLYQVARTVNPLLSRNEARELWDRIERSPCLTRLDPQQRAWIELFAAVGRRDAAIMARAAEALLPAQSDLPTGHRQYLVTAALTGYLVQGRRDAAAALLDRYSGDSGDAADLTLRLLRAHAQPPAPK